MEFQVNLKFTLIQLKLVKRRRKSINEWSLDLRAFNSLGYSFLTSFTTLLPQQNDNIEQCYNVQLDANIQERTTVFKFKPTVYRHKTMRNYLTRMLHANQQKTYKSNFTVGYWSVFVLFHKWKRFIYVQHYIEETDHLLKRYMSKPGTLFAT